MGRLYTIKHEAISVAGAITIIQLATPATCIALIHRLEISQSASTTSAQVRTQIVRKSAAATVTSYTPLEMSPGGNAALSVGGTSATGITASGEGTDTDIVFSAVWNALSGYLYLPTPEERIVVPPSSFLGVKFPANPALTITAQLIFEEIG